MNKRPMPDEQMPDEQMPDEQMPDEQMPDEQMPDEQMPDEHWNESNWPEQMERCGYFLALVTPGYLEEARTEAQREYARTLGLPTILLIEEGVDVPEDAFEGMNIVMRERFSQANGIEALSGKIRDAIADIASADHHADSR